MSATDTTNKNVGLDDGIVYLKNNDVIFGRGSGANNHAGNIRFRMLVNKRTQEYKEAKPRKIKSLIARKIVKQVKTRNGRFLMKIENAWVLASNKNILSKVKDALRMKGSNHDKASPTVLTGPPSPQAKVVAVVTTQSEECDEEGSTKLTGNQASNQNNCATISSIEQVSSPGFALLSECDKLDFNEATSFQCIHCSRPSIVPEEFRCMQSTMKHILTSGNCVASRDCSCAIDLQNAENNAISKVSTDGKNQALLSGNGCNSDYYIEEIAWRSFGNAVPASYHADYGGDLLPLLPPAPLSEFPQTGYCTWTFNEQSRVVLGCFQNEGEFVGVKDEDREFLFNMMERNDITVITEGHADELNHDVWSLEFIKKRVGTVYHHNFRRFKRQLLAEESPCQTTLYEEIDGYLTMKVADYINYLLKRSAAILKNASKKLTGDDLDFLYSDADGKKRKLHLLNDVVYMIDYDIMKMLPELYEDLVSSLKIPECLPGGQKCMMNAVCTFYALQFMFSRNFPYLLCMFLQVNQSGRPFMGPNLYMTRKSI